MAEHDIENVTFLEGSIYQLDFPDASFDACTLFSMLETLDEPVAALAEIRRVVRPGGVIGASPIEYGGLILHGPDEPLLRRFYELRLQIWEAQGDVHCYRGRELRGLFVAAGFTHVEAATTYFSYGTEERVRAFGMGRASGLPGRVVRGRDRNLRARRPGRSRRVGASLDSLGHVTRFFRRVRLGPSDRTSTVTRRVS